MHASHGPLKHLNIIMPPDGEYHLKTNNVNLIVMK